MQKCPFDNLVIVERNTKSHNYCFLHLYRNIVANISFLFCFPLLLYYFICFFFVCFCFLSANQHIFARGLTSSNPTLNKASFIRIYSFRHFPQVMYATHRQCRSRSPPSQGRKQPPPPHPRILSRRQCRFLCIEVKFDNFGQRIFQKYNQARCACYSSNKVFSLNQASLQQKSARILQHGRRGTWLASRLVQRKGCTEVDIQKPLTSIP